MATHIKIFSQKEIQSFDNPPEFDNEERKRFFHIPLWLEKIIDSFRTATNKVGFILQFGYFSAVNRFFVASKFHEKDIAFVTEALEQLTENINFKTYKERTLARHQEIILQKLAYQKFDENTKQLLLIEAVSLCSKQTNPRSMFLSLIHFLRNKKIEIPTYYAISEIITKTLQDFEKELISSLEKNLSTEDKQVLDELLKENEEYIDGEKKDLKLKRYKLTALKKSHQSTRPLKIRENICDLQLLHIIFQKLRPVIIKLELSSEIIQYYAQIAIKSKIFQIKQLEDENKKYLFLITFAMHQYYQLNDVLTDILIQSSQSTLNSSLRENKEKFYEERQLRHQVIGKIGEKLSKHIDVLELINETVNNHLLSDEEKISRIKQLLPNEQKQQCDAIKVEINYLKNESKKITKNDDYYNILESKSIKLQNRASDIIKNLEFDSDSSDQNLMKAISYYKSRDGNLINPPLDFLEPEQQSRVFDKQKKLNISLYKVLFFNYVASAIWSGLLNLKYSYKYQSFDDYLIPKEKWGIEKDDLLAKAGLLNLKNFKDLEIILKKEVDQQFQVTNQNILTGKNPYAAINDKDILKLQTPKKDEDILKTTADLFPKNRFISLFEVLSTVNNICKFTDHFEHWQIKHNREKPQNSLLFAGIIGYGCNLGTYKLAKVSHNINQHELENVINWRFSNENIIEANNEILRLIEKIQLSKLFQKNKDITHTSSDGQKFNIAVDSLNANYSYKYHGKEKGVSVYSFIDESHRLFYSTVINSSEREAAYVIDGLLHNDVVQTDIHSTDTHGYSEIIFAVTHLLGISFAPRIKNFRDQKLYGFDKPSFYKNIGYKILPSGKINAEIQAQWDDILRLIITIKLKVSPASQLFRRLSSYSKQHPLYRALKEFGRIIKTLFILKYIDDVELRQIIEKQLNKLESSNKFAKAIFFGNNQEFQQSTKEEQLIADGCKRLIENAIICWNYLYLSQMVVNSKGKSENEKSNLIDIIRNGSPVTWQHINLQGEYDFSEESLKDSMEFKLSELLT